MIRKRPTTDEGQAVVEFAVILPVLLLVLFAILQFGVVFNNYIQVTSAAREGARKAADQLARSAVAAAESAATASARSAAPDLNQSNLTITYPNSPTFTQGTDVTVKVTYPVRDQHHGRRRLVGQPDSFDHDAGRVADVCSQNSPRTQGFAAGLASPRRRPFLRPVDGRVRDRCTGAVPGADRDLRVRSGVTPTTSRSRTPPATAPARRSCRDPTKRRHDGAERPSRRRCGRSTSPIHGHQRRRPASRGRPGSR